MDATEQLPEHANTPSAIYRIGREGLHPDLETKTILLDSTPAGF